MLDDAGTRRDDDADAEPNAAPAADALRAAPAADGQHDFKAWQSVRSDLTEHIKWNEMGYVADDLKKHRSAFAACIPSPFYLPRRVAKEISRGVKCSACRLANDPQETHGCSFLGHSAA